MELYLCGCVSNNNKIEHPDARKLEPWPEVPLMILCIKAKNVKVIFMKTLNIEKPNCSVTQRFQP